MVTTIKNECMKYFIKRSFILFCLLSTYGGIFLGIHLIPSSYKQQPITIENVYAVYEIPTPALPPEPAQSLVGGTSTSSCRGNCTQVAANVTPDGNYGSSVNWASDISSPGKFKYGINYIWNGTSSKPKEFDISATVTYAYATCYCTEGAGQLSNGGRGCWSNCTWKDGSPVTDTENPPPGVIESISLTKGQTKSIRVERKNLDNCGSIQTDLFPLTVKGSNKTNHCTVGPLTWSLYFTNKDCVTSSPTPTASPIPSPTITGSPTPTLEISLTPTSTSSPSPTPSGTITPTITPSPSPSATPTQVPNTCIIDVPIQKYYPVCQNIKIYKNGQIVDSHSIIPGDTIQFAITNTNAKKIRIQINNNPWIESSDKNTQGEFIVPYTLGTDTITYTVKAQVTRDGVTWY
jgi:hypothetical protein